MGALVDYILKSTDYSSVYCMTSGLYIKRLIKALFLSTYYEMLFNNCSIYREINNIILFKTYSK